MKKHAKLLAVLMVLAMLLGLLAACQSEEPAGTTAGTEPPKATATPKPTDKPAETTEPPAPPKYTYNTYMGAHPKNWNPHAWQMSNESTIQSYLFAPFVDTKMADDGVNFEWMYEAATAITDITETFAAKEKFGIKEGDKNRVYIIDLNPDVKWDDGTPINADDYIWSMQKLLDPEMKNYRSNSYTSGPSQIVNAYWYFHGEKAGTPFYTPATDGKDDLEGHEGKLYASLVGDIKSFGMSFQALPKTYARYASSFELESGENLLDKYADQPDYFEVTDEIRADFSEVIGNVFGMEEVSDDDFKAFVFHATSLYKEVTWSDVGLLKTGEYQLAYVLENPLQEFYFLSNQTGASWVVHREKYEATMTTEGKLKATNYCTSFETAASTGPYRVASFEPDKQVVLERNPHWFGYHDGKHEGQYVADEVKIEIIGEPETALQLFQQGKLDDLVLQSKDVTTYRMSDNLLKTDLTYNFRFIFNSDLNVLKNLEDAAGDGANKRILHYKDFRQGISLAIDRARFAREATSAYKPNYGLLSSLYYYDIANDPTSIYRNTTEAKEAVLRLYDIKYGPGEKYADVDSAYESVTGYDVTAAKEHFQAAYDQAVADGNYTDGQAININCIAASSDSLSADDTKQMELLDEFVGEATKGTPIEGKVKFNFSVGKSRYDDVALGKVEMIRGAWGGAAFYPFNTIRVYTDPDYMGGLQKIHESGGWDPRNHMLKLKYDFDGTGEVELEKSLTQWSQEMNDPKVYGSNAKTQLFILSNIETAVLSTYQTIPFASETEVSLFSKKWEPATLNYNIMFGYGGFRFYEFHYNDAEWEKYVADQGGTLNYE